MPVTEVLDITAELKKIIDAESPNVSPSPVKIPEQLRLFRGVEPKNKTTDNSFSKFIRAHPELIRQDEKAPSPHSETPSLFDLAADTTVPLKGIMNTMPSDEEAGQDDDSRVWIDVMNSGKSSIVNDDDEQAFDVALTIETDGNEEAKVRRSGRGRLFGISVAKEFSFIGDDTAEHFLSEIVDSNTSEPEVNQPSIIDELINDEDRLVGLVESILKARAERVYTIQPIPVKSTRPQYPELAVLTKKEEKRKKVNNYTEEVDGSTDLKPSFKEKIVHAKDRVADVAEKAIENLNKLTESKVEENKKTPGTDFVIITDKVLEEIPEGLFDWLKMELHAIRIGRVPDSKTAREQLASVLVTLGMLLPQGLLARMPDKDTSEKNNGIPPAAATIEVAGILPQAEIGGNLHPGNSPSEAVINSEAAAEIETTKKNQLLVVKALKDEGILTRNVVAYSLATMKAESNFMPVREGWYLDVRDGLEPGTSGKRIATENGYKGGKDKYGRGFIQLTHDYNYKWADERLGLNGALIRNPDLALDPSIAARIFAAFVKDKGVARLAEADKFVEARGPINGRDKAQTIAHDAEHYLSDPLLDELIKTINEVTGPYGSVVEWNQKIIDALIIGIGPHGGEYDDLPIEFTSPGGQTTPKTRWWEGDYWCTYSIIDAYNLAGIKGLTPDNSEGVEKMRATFQSDPGFKYIEYVNADHKAVLQQVRPGYAMIMEEKLGSKDHNAHVGMVKKIEIDGNGNGKIVSLESNANKKEKTYEVSDWKIKGTVVPVVAFGGFETV
jgi:predicted chitinase